MLTIWSACINVNEVHVLMLKHHSEKENRYKGDSLYDWTQFNSVLAAGVWILS